MVFPTHWEESLLFLGLEKAAPPPQKKARTSPWVRGARHAGLLWACPFNLDVALAGGNDDSPRLQWAELHVRAPPVG